MPKSIRSLSLLAAVMLLPAVDLAAQGLPTQTWPAGTQVSMWNHGGRITTFHRGYLYLGMTLVFGYTTVENMMTRPEGIKIASCFVVGIVAASLLSCRASLGFT